MTSPAFSPDWLKQFSDPYAILGVAVTADERRIAKRYRQIAKRLHPDQQIGASEAAREFANIVLTRLVNPAYQRLKQDKGRAEALATLRFKVRRLTREDKLITQVTQSQQLLQVNEAEVDIFYENALTELSDNQYSSTDSFSAQTDAIAELNLVYLRRKMGEPVIREKRTGLMSTAKTASPISVTEAEAEAEQQSATQSAEQPQVDYGQRHVVRAKTYIASKSYAEAVQELRDAVRIDPNNSNYHTMLGQAYLLQQLSGMAKVHIRQALKLDPKNRIAQKYAKQLEIQIPPQGASNNGHAKSPDQGKKGSFFKLFSSKRAKK
ncbi:MAG: J domain-containing protein [Cyanobacteria bacterium P01_H01_bin.152]